MRSAEKRYPDCVDGDYWKRVKLDPRCADDPNETRQRCDPPMKTCLSCRLRNLDEEENVEGKSNDDESATTSSCDTNLQGSSTSSSAFNDAFIKRERDKIDKFYSDARTLALKTFDDYFAKRSPQNQNDDNGTKLDNMKQLIESFQAMWKKDVIGDEATSSEPADKNKNTDNEPNAVIPSECYNIIFPNVESMNIQFETKNTEASEPQNQEKFLLPSLFGFPVNGGLPVVNQLHTLENKIPALYYANFSFSLSMMFSRELDSVGIHSVENLDNGKLCFYENGQRILKLNHQPKNDTINLSMYKYIAVVGLWNGLKNYGEDLLDEQMKNTWCTKIIVVIFIKDWKKDKELVERIKKIGVIDKRVTFLNTGDGGKLYDLLFEK